MLIVDQFEELFTAGEDAEVGRVEREAFVAALHAAAAVPAGPRKLPQALAVAVVRADFLGRLIAYSAIKGGAGRRAVHGRADERGRIAAGDDRACC